MFERILAVLAKEFKQIFRDPRMKTIIFISPLIQVLIFGYAANMDVTNVPIAIRDLDNTKQSRDLIRQFSFSRYFDIKKYADSEKEEVYLIDSAKVNAVLKFNRGFARDFVAGKSAEVQLIMDGAHSNTAMIILGYAGQIVNQYNYQTLEERYRALAENDTECPRVDLRERRWFNENLESRNYFLPGVIALIVTVMSLLLSSMAIVREKEIGTMEQLIVSPIRPIELIAGKIIPFGIIALAQVTFITTVGVFWFGVPMRGNLLFLFGCTIIYLLTTLGIGIFISTVSSTQQEAMMSVFLFYMPASLLSGFAYPIANMPQAIQYLTYLNPLRYFLVILRSIFLKGVGLIVLWDQITVLLFIGIGIITLSSLRFGRRLD